MVCGGGAPFFARTASAHVWKKVDMEYLSAAWWCVVDAGPAALVE
jgi:hypothetical protein